MFLHQQAWFVYAVICFCVLPKGSCYCRNRTYETRQYTICSGDYTKPAAQVKCQDLNMRLAIILTQEELSHWKSYLFISQLFYGEVWVGATFSKAQNEFVWDEGNYSVPHSFIEAHGNPDYSGIPDGACLRIAWVVRLRWHLCNSTDTGYFCQESFPLTLETTTFETDTTVTATELTTAGTSLEYTDTTVTTTELTTADTSLEYTDTTHTTAISTDVITTNGYNEQTDQGVTDTTITSITTGLSTNPENGQLACYCSCASTNLPSGQAELEVFKQESKEKIEKQLFVDTTTLSSTVRRKTSADDERPSAQSVGYLGVTLMAISFFLIFALDITKVGACGQCLSSCVKKDKLI